MSELPCAPTCQCTEVQQCAHTYRLARQSALKVAGAHSTLLEGTEQKLPLWRVVRALMASLLGMLILDIEVETSISKVYSIPKSSISNLYFGIEVLKFGQGSSREGLTK